MSGIAVNESTFIVLGERDGISGEAISAVVLASGGRVLLSNTDCYV
jgi:hypothetical protein